MSNTSVCIFYFPLNSTNLIFWTIHKIWWTCLLPIAAVVTINILCISWRGPPFIWHPLPAFMAFFVKFALLLFFQNEICAYGNNNNCSYNIAMTSLTTVATTTTKLSDWHWSHFGVFGFGHFFGVFFGCLGVRFTTLLKFLWLGHQLV